MSENKQGKKPPVIVETNRSDRGQSKSESKVAELTGLIVSNTLPPPGKPDKPGQSGKSGGGSKQEK